MCLRLNSVKILDAAGIKEILSCSVHSLERGIDSGLKTRRCCRAKLHCRVSCGLEPRMRDLCFLTHRRICSLRLWVVITTAKELNYKKVMSAPSGVFFVQTGPVHYIHSLGIAFVLSFP